MTVFSFLNPFLLWGLAAIAVPILIHLLLRQKPKPRPWAAMRWLQAALHASQKRYKLTNLLLLLLRCLIIALLVLAVSRPHWGLWSSGGDLVILIDVSASMANDDNGKGPLQAARDQLQAQGFNQDRICIISVGQQAQVLSNSDAASAISALLQLDSDYLPGGLNHALSDESLALITSQLRPHSTVLCISDFRQDDGLALQKTLSNSVHQVTRWQVGEQLENAYVYDLPALPDFVAAQAQQFQIMLNGQAEEIAQLKIDNGSASPITIQDPMQISIPPLAPGKHQIELQFKDQGLAYDNTLQLAIEVRGPVPCLIVQQQYGYLAAVVDAAHQQLAYRHIDSARLHTEPLPENGILILDSEVSSIERIVRWVQDGGVLMLWSDTLAQHQQLAELCPDISAPEELLGSGKIEHDDTLITRTFSHLQFEQLRCLQLGPSASSLLNLGTQSLAAHCRVGNGYVMVCSQSLRQNDQFWAQGSAPYWLQNTLRSSSALARQPRIIHAGEVLHQKLVLSFDDGSEKSFEVGEMLALKPGLATEISSKRAVIILPNREESLLALPRHDGLARDMKAAIPNQLGSDWSAWILILLVMLCMAECLFAGHAGRAYGQ